MDIKMQYGSMLENKNVIITAGASGIGKECALLFAAHGANTTIVDIDREKGNELLKELNENGKKNDFLCVDLCDLEAVEEMCKTYLNKYTAPEVWLNCAGVCRPSFIDEVNNSDIEYMFSLNLISAFKIMKNFANCMIENHGGTVVQIASSYALRGCNGMSGYAASKGALVALTNAFALDYASYGIRANSILPGSNFSSMGDRILNELGEIDAKKYFEQLQMLPRRGQLIEIANTALFLASDMSRLITAESIFVDGGQNIIAHKQIPIMSKWKDLSEDELSRFTRR